MEPHKRGREGDEGVQSAPAHNEIHEVVKRRRENEGRVPATHRKRDREDDDPVPLPTKQVQLVLAGLNGGPQIPVADLWSTLTTSNDQTIKFLDEVYPVTSESVQMMHQEGADKYCPTVVQWAYYNDEEFLDTLLVRDDLRQLVFVEWAANGEFDMIVAKWQNMPPDVCREACREAARSGYLLIVKFFELQELLPRSLLFDLCTPTLPELQKEQVELVRQYYGDDRFDQEGILLAAVADRRTDILNAVWRQLNECQQEELLAQVCTAGNVEMMAFLLERGAPVTDMAVYQASQHQDHGDVMVESLFAALASVNFHGMSDDE
jgi:hypothetical protein